MYSGILLPMDFPFILVGTCWKTKTGIKCEAQRVTSLPNVLLGIQVSKRAVTSNYLVSAWQQTCGAVRTNHNWTISRLTRFRFTVIGMGKESKGGSDCANECETGAE